MITREQIVELASFESAGGDAVSFYFQPGTPQDRSHRAEAILAKDLVRNALRAATRNGNGTPVRADLERILALAESLHGNHARAKAVFACAARGFWREFDLPPRLRESDLAVASRFRVKPLACVMDGSPRCAIALIDREKARVFDLRFGELSERLGIFNDLPRRGRSDGWSGYDAGHIERHVENEAQRHLKNVAERLLDELKTRSSFDVLVIGCRDELWPDVEASLHNYLRQRLVGHFQIDAAVASPEQVRAEAERLLQEHVQAERQGLVREVLGQAQRNGLGAVRLHNVLRALERGEVQTLLLGEDFSATVAECQHCGHLDPRMVEQCAVCGQAMREVKDVSEILVARAMTSGAELVFLRDEDLERAGNVGALLRFRADQNTAAKLAG
jgi:peptide subunit release factor 1 (eRF1)